ncbi:MAG: SixA phosphatase family protein [Flavobacteriales bacterium]
MKTLYLVRHAKSSWSDLTLSDFDRPLNERGKRNAPFMGKIFRSKGIKPDLIVSSPAKRALSTAKKIAKEIDYETENIKTESSIYEADLRTLLKVVNELPTKAKTVMLFGHNPGITEFANYLAGTDISNIPTCGMVCIRFSTSKWEEISRDTGTFVEFDYPKNYPKGY